MNKQHELKATPRSVHWGYFDAALPPVLEIGSGDTVVVDTVSGQPDELPALRTHVLPEHLEILAEVPHFLGPHVLTGPIWVRDAEPGDVLEVRIHSVKLRQRWGYNTMRPLKGTLPDEYPKLRHSHFDIDIESKTGTLPWGKKIALNPFFGVMGVAPPSSYGRINSSDPREFGGNMDCKARTEGSTLFLPVFNKGALFSVGDGHATQGDGEVNLTALETALNGTLEFVLHKGKTLRWPRATTKTHYVTIAMDPDLDDAAKIALREMIAWITEMSGLSREDAYMLCSLACDLRVTQLVTANKGIYAMLPKELL